MKKYSLLLLCLFVPSLAFSQERFDESRDDQAAVSTPSLGTIVNEDGVEIDFYELENESREIAIGIMAPHGARDNIVYLIEEQRATPLQIWNTLAPERRAPEALIRDHIKQTGSTEYPTTLSISTPDSSSSWWSKEFNDIICDPASTYFDTNHQIFLTYNYHWHWQLWHDKIKYHDPDRTVWTAITVPGMRTIRSNVCIADPAYSSKQKNFLNHRVHNGFGGTILTQTLPALFGGNYVHIFYVFNTNNQEQFRSSVYDSRGLARFGHGLMARWW